jgi:curli biogenesis system outer membrane secretion channel CsgG
MSKSIICAVALGLITLTACEQQSSTPTASSTADVAASPTPAPEPPINPKPLVSQFRNSLTGLKKADVRARLGTPFGAHDDLWTYMDFAYDEDAGKVVSLAVVFNVDGSVKRVEAF